MAMGTRAEAISGILSFLASTPLFAGMNEASLLSLAQECSLSCVEKDGVLFLQSDPADAAYIVRSGTISIILNSRDGREMVIGEMQSGDLLGELGILTRKTHSTSAIARTKSEVLVIPSRVFRKIVEGEHQVTLRVLEITAERLQKSGKRARK